MDYTWKITTESSFYNSTRPKFTDETICNGIEEHEQLWSIEAIDNYTIYHLVDGKWKKVNIDYVYNYINKKDSPCTHQQN